MPKSGVDQGKDIDWVLYIIRWHKNVALQNVGALNQGQWQSYNFFNGYHDPQKKGKKKVEIIFYWTKTWSLL